MMLKKSSGIKVKTFKYWTKVSSHACASLPLWFTVLPNVDWAGSVSTSGAILNKCFSTFCPIHLKWHPLSVTPEPSESHTNMLKAYQSLEPGDFTGFLKILRSPPSQRLQSQCTAFLKTMEAYHVIFCSTSNFLKFSIYTLMLLWS